MRIHFISLAILMPGACQTTSAKNNASKRELVDGLFAAFNQHDSLLKFS